MKKFIEKDVTENPMYHDTWKLLKKYRDVVLLRLYAELPFSQIAESMKITENSAKVLFHRAKKLLMEELKNEYFM